MPLLAPFPYFGKKTKIAPIVWNFLGQPTVYIEPFFGAGAVLLNRPFYNPKRHIEIAGDLDGLVCNAWRAIKFNPQETAYWCFWIASEIELKARHKFLAENMKSLTEKLINNPDYYDAKMAGFYIWYLNYAFRGKSIARIKKPTIFLTSKFSHFLTSSSLEDILERFHTLSERLKYVSFICDDWKRAFKENFLREDKYDIIGVFLDPPYDAKTRDKRLYNVDQPEISAEVLEWCKKYGNNPKMRIVLCGYEEYQELIENYGWFFVKWKANAGYSVACKKTNRSILNRYRETIYISPYCLNLFACNLKE